MEKKLLKRTEAAAYLGFSRKTLENWDAQGIGPDVVRLPSGLPAYSVDHLDEFIEASREIKRLSARKS